MNLMPTLPIELDNALAMLAGLLALAGIVQCVAGWWLVARFARTPAPPVPAFLPHVLLLKPLHGDEALLEQALATACAQDYPHLRIVCGIQNPADPATAVVKRLRARFPARDIALVVDPTPHGPNRKIANLINMLAAVPDLAPDEIVVIADSDIHAAPDWLRLVVATLAKPGTGLATTLYTGLAAASGMVARLGSTGITHSFLPGALLARALGRQDCLGATMALRAATLAEIGGFAALSVHLADDNELGRLVRARGQAVALAPTVPATTVGETTLPDLLGHELRWARTNRGLVPVTFALSSIQYPIAWAVLALALCAEPWAAALVLLAWAVRALAAAGIDRALGSMATAPRPTSVPMALLPLRDLMSLVLVAAAYAGRRVRWRGALLEFPARGAT